MIADETVDKGDLSLDAGKACQLRVVLELMIDNVPAQKHLTIRLH